MPIPTAYVARDGQQYVRLRTTIADTLDLDYVAYLGTLHESFESDMSPAAFRKAVTDVFGSRGSRGQESWGDDLDNIDPDVYAAAKALAVRAYGFDVPTNPEA